MRNLRAKVKQSPRFYGVGLLAIIIIMLFGVVGAGMNFFNGESITVVNLLKLNGTTDRTTVAPSERIEGKFTVRNDGGSDWITSEIGIKVTGPTQYLDFGWTRGKTLKPGESLDFSGAIVTAPNDPGDYTTQITWRDGQGNWSSLGNSVPFTIRRGSGSPSNPGDGIQLCDQANYGGTCKTFTSGKYTNLQDQGWNDRTVSVRFVGNYSGHYHVVLNTEPNFTGDPYHADGDVSQLDKAHSGHIRSLEIYFTH